MAKKTPGKMRDDFGAAIADCWRSQQAAKEAANRVTLDRELVSNLVDNIFARKLFDEEVEAFCKALESHINYPVFTGHKEA